MTVVAAEERPSWGYQRLLSEGLAIATAALDIQTGAGEVLAGAGAENFPLTLVATRDGRPTSRRRPRCFIRFESGWGRPPVTSTKLPAVGSGVIRYRIDIYKVFISHRYVRSDEYRRLVRMLDRAQARDPTWRWENLSVPVDAPIMTAAEAQQGETYERRIRERIGQVHVVLFILRDEWLEDVGSLYLELVEGTSTRYRPTVPIISILPRGADPRALQYAPPGEAMVRWNARSIIRAIRTHALPVSADELLLTPAQAQERARIVTTLTAHRNNLAVAAASLGISQSTLRRRRIDYLIR